MNTDEIINSMMLGVSKYLPDEAMSRLRQDIEDANAILDAAKINKRKDQPVHSNTSSDPDVYTNLQNMINNDQKVSMEFSNIIETLYAKNKKFYTILRDYEIMPILIPQINRVLQFLVNESVSPDIQNDRTFELKYIGASGNGASIQADLNKIRKEMKLDSLLPTIYQDRYKIQHVYYRVIDYNETFDKMTQAIQTKMLNESVSPETCMNTFDNLAARMTSTINEATFNVNYSLSRVNNAPETVNTDISLDKLNIVIERSPIVECVQTVKNEVMSRKYEKYSMKSVMNEWATGVINEDASDDFMKQFEEVIANLKKKKMRRCHLERLDPSRTFSLKLGGRQIGYFYITDINQTQGSAYNTQFGQSLKDRLMKSRNLSTSTTVDVAGAEKAIAKVLAEKIIKSFDPSIGIAQIEDIDLMHDYIINNELFNGNKRLTFYYKDDVFDMSRTEGSLLTNAVFFTKLYSMTLLNNIVTKVLRGRGRQIHTVKLGASNATRQYIQNAVVALNNPEANLGMIHGSFEQLLNPLNASSDIIIPTEDDAERFITTDYIEGQNVDMDTDFLKFLLNSIVSAFGLDNAVLDATNGQIQFAKTLSMESLQICNSVRNEQNDLYDSWRDFCLRIVEIMGEDDTKSALTDGLIQVTFYSPKSLILQNALDEMSNVKNYAENVADIIPHFNTDNSNPMHRNVFVYNIVKAMTNIDWTPIDTAFKEAKIAATDVSLDDAIEVLIKSYIDNTETHNHGDPLPEEFGGEVNEDEFTGDEEIPGLDDSGELEEPEETPAEEEEPPVEEEPEENPENEELPEEEPAEDEDEE